MKEIDAREAALAGCSLVQGGAELSLCGEGVVEGSEVCVDGFMDDCGSCNATCSGFVYAASVEFFLGWLEEADEDGDFGMVAGALYKMPTSSVAPEVFDIERAGQ